MSRLMRLLVLFDLPVKEPHHRRAAAQFRAFLIKDGYQMMQYSVYVRICNGMDAVEKHVRRLKANVPDDGSIRCMCVTEKQFEAMLLLTGTRTKAEKNAKNHQVSFF